MSGGVIATAVIIPVIAILVAVCLLYAMRKKKNKNNAVAPTPEDGSEA